MKPNQKLATHGTLLKQILQIIQSFSAPLRLLLAIVFCAASASADTLIWDAGNTNNGATIDPASGAWDTDITTNINWNNGTSNVSWTQGGPTTPLNGAAFNGPDAADGTYQVVVDDASGRVSASNLTINASGYAFSGLPIDLRNAVSAFAATNLFVIADGKSITISNDLGGANTSSEFRLGGNGTPATVVLFGAMTGFQSRITSTNGSVFYLAGPGTSSAGSTHIDADVRMTNGTFNSAGAFVVGRRQNGSQPLNGTGSFTVDGPTTVLNQTADYISVGRDSVWNSTFILQNGGTVNFQTGARNNNFEFGIPRPGSSGANNQSWAKVLGGTLNMGPGSDASAFPRTIKIADGGSRAGQISVLTQSGGVINAWAGIQIGGGGTYDGGTGALTNSGGFLYIGNYGGNGIRYGTGIPPTNNVSLSGGTVGALQNWISSVPMTLGTLNGNITFQCADGSSTPFNIGLSGSLTGPGGFNKSGGGVLTLTGTNSYAGVTVVSNGILVVSTANLPRSGDVILDGSGAASGFPVVTNSVNNTAQNWNMTNLTFAAGTPMMSFNYGNNPLSTTVAPVQANGNLTFTITPNIDVYGASIPSGTYPLIKYTGTLSGTPPTTIVTLPPGVTAATIVNNAGNKSIDLQITSTNNPALKWLAGNGTWDTSTPNWTQGGGPTLYTDDGTKDVVFDDSASGNSPILITLNSTLNNPKSVTANNATKAYVISGTGSIGGTEPWIVSGAGSLTLSNANTYSGGTTVAGPGQLNINYGGTGGAASAIGTGALNISGTASGAKIDNTSGHTVVLNTAPPLPINWVDDWTFVGTGNLDLGLGQVTMGNSQVILTVVSNTLTVNNPIGESIPGCQLIKAGNGSLTLSNANSFSGGLTLVAGTLNLNIEGAVGSGPLRIQGGVLDNTSGADVNESSPSSLELLHDFTFNGSGNLNLATAQITIGNNTITLNGTNALITSGAFTGGNRSTTVNGTGKWIMAGDGANQNLGLTINGGTVYFNKSSGSAQNNPVTINTNGSLVMLNPSTTQIATGTQITLGGGLLDLNGDTESLGTLVFNSGILRNSAASTASGLNVSGAVTLAGASCIIDVPTVDSSLTLSSASGSGGLVTTGQGVVIITTNGYTGDTTVSNGTLILNFPTLGTNSTVTVSTNATLGTNGILTLNFPDTNPVAALILGGVSKPAGVYSATTDPLYIAGSGSLLVVPPVSTINPIGGPIQFTNLGGGNLTLSWPTNLGWILQAQTNGGIDLSSNAWFDVGGSSNVTTTNITIAPTNAFFRLRHP